LVGCSKSADVADGPKGDPQEWAWLQETQPKLMAQRAELRELADRQRLAATDEEKAQIAEEITAKETALAETLDGPSVGQPGFSSRLVGYIMSLDMREGDPVTPQQLAAIRMKTAEDMAVAREWIEKGGDYVKAIDIYNSALINDPDNEALKAALAEAEDLRFMKPERFAQVKKGMTEEEVRDALGPVNIRNVRIDEEKNVTTWLYRTEDGGAAGVFFKANRAGEALKVYDSKFDFFKPQVVGAQQEAAPTT
jgi:tetratricopeptide (TPR) repeat protein